MKPEGIEVILDQVGVAYGQGSGAVDVSPAAVAALREYYGSAITEDVIATWDRVAAQALERVRTAGRLAAQTAIEEATAAIEAQPAIAAACAVSQRSATPICPPDPFPPIVWQLDADDRDNRLGQAFVAFGQGTGAVRVSRAGATALRTHFSGRSEVTGRGAEVPAPLLEQARILGRMASQLATRRGSTVIGAEEVEAAIATLSRSEPLSLPPAALVAARPWQSEGRAASH